MNTVKDVKLFFAEGLHYKCTGCGKCCKNHWDIPVTPRKAESIKKTRLYQDKVKAGYTPLRVAENQEIFLGTHDGGCTFLTGDLCQLHIDHGGDSKPMACQIFPLNLVHTPDGYYVSLSFACPAVLAGVGPELESQGEWLNGILGTGAAIPPMVRVSEPVHLSTDCDISWQHYLEFENSLLSRLNEQLSPMDFIAWACSVLENISDFGGFNPARLDLSQESVLVPHALDMLGMFGRVLVGIIELEDDMERREEFIDSLCRDNEVESLKAGVPLPAFGYYPLSSDISRGLVVRFFRSQLEGKRLLAGASVAARLLAFGTGYAVLCFYLEALGRARGERHFSFEHLEQAFSIVEENILTHSDDLEPYFEKYEQMLTSILV